MDAVADSSFVIAVALAKDPSHEICASIFKRYTIIYLPQTTLAEVGYFLTKIGGNRAAAAFLRHLPDTKYRPVALVEADFLRAAAILEKYADSRVDFVDATTAAVAERLRVNTILTLDRRDFGLIHPAHIDHFETLPEA